MLNSISENPSVLYGPEPNPGDRVGNYILDRKIGAGGMGHVWKATHEATGEPYAVKLLPQMIAAHPDAWDQVLANFQLVRKLNHQNICPVLFLERDPKWGPYLVMTFIDGISLAKYRQRKEAFTVEEVAALLKPVAEALDYAHAQKIIHRDVKHDNILLTLAEDGETITGTFVIDFGLAAQVRSTINRFSQQSVTAVGTRPYMAPEIWRSRPPVAASDQYALGVIAYELLAGFFPFDGDDIAVLRESVLKDEVEGISSLCDSHNRSLSRVLDKEPSKRFADGILEFISSLGNGSSNPATLSKADQLAQNLEQFIREDIKGTFEEDAPGHIDQWTIMGKEGSVLSQFALGACYVLGIGLEKDFATGFEYFRQAAIAGHVPSIYMMAKSLWDHVDGPKDGEKAGPIMMHAANEGYLPAMMRIAEECEKVANEASKTDDEKRQLWDAAFKWYKKSMEQGKLQAKFHVGRLTVEEKIHTESASLAQDGWTMVEESAQAGVIAAQYFLGETTLFGKHGRTQDVREGIKWLTKAAERGDGNATTYLAAWYLKGPLENRDNALGIKYLRMCADAGDAESQFMIANAYRSGFGSIVPDQTEALKWYEMSAAQGHVPAILEVVNLYGGVGELPPNQERAYYWLTEGAKAGSAEAACYAGMAALDGNGTEKSRTTAIYWLRKAAVAGHADAQRFLGLQLMKGKGGDDKFGLNGADEEFEEAAMWLVKAVDSYSNECDLAIDKRLHEAAWLLGLAGLARPHLNPVKALNLFGFKAEVAATVLLGSSGMPLHILMASLEDKLQRESK